MIDRSTLVTACLVVLLVASLPAGAYASQSASASASVSSQDVEDESLLDSLGCLPAPSLRDIAMNAYRQESTNLETQSAAVDARENRTTEVNGTFRIESGYIAADTLCIDGTAEDHDGLRLELNGVEFEDTVLLGPRTDVAFEQGTADSMTVVLPPEEVLSLLVQIPGSIDLIDTIKDAFGIEGDFGASAERDESDDENDEDNGSVIDDDPVDNTTDAINDTVDNTTDAIDNTTDAINDTIDNTTDAVNDTVDNTTDAVDDAVNDTTGVIDDTVDNTTDAINDTVDGPEPVEDAVDGTTDVVDDTVDNTTDAVEGTVDATTDVLEGTVDATTDLLGGIG